MFLIIQTETVKEELARFATSYLSERLNTRVYVGKVNVRSFNKIILENLYIEDLHHDTLLYSQKLKLKINDIDIENNKIDFASIDLVNTKSKLIKYKSEPHFNYQFIIDSFKSDTTINKTKTYWGIRFGEVKVTNTDFSFRNENKTFVTSGINYFDLRATSVNGKFRDIVIDHDTISGKINYLAATEKSGFVLQNLSSIVNISPVGMQLDELKIKTPYSLIATDLSFKYKRYQDFLDYNNSVVMLGVFDGSAIELNDIAYFAPALRGIYKKLIVSGRISGKVNNLNGKQMNVRLSGTNTRFVGNIKLKGLPKIEETAIYLNVKQLKTNYYDLKNIPVYPFTSQKRMNVPANIAHLGNIKFKGTFAGFISDFYAYGKFTTAIGSLSSDLSLRYDEDLKKEVYNGKLKSTEFDFGKYFGIAALGAVSGNVAIGGAGLTLDKLSANLDGTITRLALKNYIYENIRVEGDIAHKIFSGKLGVNDDNVDFDFNGKVDFSNAQPKLDFVTTVNRANLSALHMVDSAKKAVLSTKMIIDVTGSTIDDLDGQIRFSNTSYMQNGDNYIMNAFKLNSHHTGDIKTLVLNSDFVDGEVSGVFSLLDLPMSINKMLSIYLPSYFEVKGDGKETVRQDFKYRLKFKNSSPITTLFFPQLSLSPNSRVSGEYNSLLNYMFTKGKSSTLSYDNIVFTNLILKSNSSDRFKLNIVSERLSLTDSIWLDNFSVITTTRTDSINVALRWDNKSRKKIKGDVKAFVHFDSHRKYNIKLLPSQFIIADSVWTVSKSNEVFVDSNYVLVKNVLLEKGNQSVGIDGVVSDNKKDKLKFTINNFDLANLNIYTEIKGLKLSGQLNSDFSIADIYRVPIFRSTSNFSSLFVNENKVGDGSVESIWSNAKEALYMHGSFSLGIVPNILFSGNYYPQRKANSLDLELSFQALQLQMFKPLVKKYCSDFSGYFAGRVNVLGSLKEPKLSGSLNINAKKIRVNYLNTVYNFSDQIEITNNSFNFDNVTVYDVNHNNAEVKGKLYHTNFREFQLDFDIATDKFNCLNTKEVHNNLYYGKAFVSGVVNVSGFTNDVLIEANVRAESVTSNGGNNRLNPLSKTEDSKLYIPISESGELKSNSFISFVKKDNAVVLENDYKVELGGVKLNIDLELTPDAEVQLIFDQNEGDIIKAKGNGNIKLNIDANGEFKMYGNYVIEAGDYLFTLKSDMFNSTLINKRFDIKRGSTIKWNGSPYKAKLDLTSIYKARASLGPFFPDSISTSASIDTKKRYPVDVKLFMSNDLMSPDITFDIDIPTVDASTRREVLSYINNDVEMNRQVFSLLILNSFFQPLNLSNVGSMATVNTSELLSNQLSNMLRNISDDFDVGINYLAGDNISKDELEVALSTQLFNNKLSIDGNLGVSENNQNTNNLVGDVNVDYKLTDDGKLRIKAFNKSNDITNQVISNGLYTQGIGLFYREEFNALSELYKRYMDRIKNGTKNK